MPSTNRVQKKTDLVYLYLHRNDEGRVQTVQRERLVRSAGEHRFFYKLPDEARRAAPGQHGAPTRRGAPLRLFVQTR